jgi:hypothetical protein
LEEVRYSEKPAASRNTSIGMRRFVGAPFIIFSSLVLTTEADPLGPSPKETASQHLNMLHPE